MVENVSISVITPYELSPKNFDPIMKSNSAGIKRTRSDSITRGCLSRGSVLSSAKKKLRRCTRYGVRGSTIIKWDATVMERDNSTSLAGLNIFSKKSNEEKGESTQSDTWYSVSEIYLVRHVVS